MSTIAWVLVGAPGALYLALVFTLAITTYRKGSIWLFALGFLLPALWLIGAITRPKPGSEYARREREYWHELDR